MAGKKKATLANKLAKMTDEEKAKYLQHKMQIEEEAKRRKELLISTFMKTKIRREEAFSRLNLAKINQNWHQILRKAKCQEMKENVEHMKEWIERLLDYKTRTISKLLEELEEAEEQYSNNLQCHSTHIDNIIDEQNQYIDNLQKQYDKDLEKFLESTNTEMETTTKNANSEEEYLKTILFAQESLTNQALRQDFEHYMQAYYETEHNFRAKLRQMKKSREGVSRAIWKQIATVVRLYVQQTDSRRCHLVLLRKVDADSAAEIAANEERIRRQEDLVYKLKIQHKDLLEERQQKIKDLEIEQKELNTYFLKIKRNLQQDLQIDDKKIKLLTETSNSSLDFLQKLAVKGEHMKNLAQNCKRFETNREEITKWLPICDVTDIYEKGDDIKATKFIGDKIKIISDHFIDAKTMKWEKDLDNKIKTIEEQPVSDHLDMLKDGALPHLKLEDKIEMKTSPTRPKTAISGRLVKSAQSTTATSTPESRRIVAVKNVIFQSKSLPEMCKPPSTSPSSSCSGSTTSKESKNILDRCFESLKDLENFWFMFNKVEVDYIEIKEEKKILEKENKQLRGMIRAILEAAALSETIPSSKVSTRVPSRRSAYSAPLRRILFT